jgi:3',5'-cyclic AMP phosphodiesterase CpdA
MKEKHSHESFGDPRLGDFEDDISSTKQRSLFSIAGSMLTEISLPKLVFAWVLSIALPAILLGLAPLAATAWAATVTDELAGFTGIGAILLLLASAAVGWFGWRPLLRMAETNFWSLNALAVQPGYAFFREAIRHLAEQAIGRRWGEKSRAKMRAASAAAAGILLFAIALLVIYLVWPATRWAGTPADLVALQRFIVPAIANAVVIVSAYLAGAALFWGIADATMDQPLDLSAFDTVPKNARRWRVAHLSDVHVVGERYGFRIESGRVGPRGNDRFQLAMDRLAAIHAEDPVDLILITGDMTDAGLSIEWAAFDDVLARYPQLKARMYLLPGNHDVNIVDRANPARLDLSFSQTKRLRQLRTLAAMANLQGERVTVIDGKHKTRTLASALDRHRQDVARFSNQGGFRLSFEVGKLWDDLHPMMLPPASEDGLGVVILNSNAETHFSFTNALGFIPMDQARRLRDLIRMYPKASWIVALHHHVVEYPTRVKAFSERIGTALVNGSWFVRKLAPIAQRAIVMHGHRHIDWIGACGALRIISAPSPVMGYKDEPTHFYVHTLATSGDGRLLLGEPQRVDLSASV